MVNPRRTQLSLTSVTLRTRRFYAKPFRFVRRRGAPAPGDFRREERDVLTVEFTVMVFRASGSMRARVQAGRSVFISGRHR